MDRRIFISHSSKDQKLALSVCRALESRGIGCWISSRDIGPGENYQSAIVDAIASAGAMILVFSENANNSNEIKKEVALAGQNQVLIIPVRSEDVIPSGAFRYELVTRQWIDLFDNWEAAIDRIIHQFSLAAGDRGESATRGTAKSLRTKFGPVRWKTAVVAVAVIGSAAMLLWALHVGRKGPFSTYPLAAPASIETQVTAFALVVTTLRDNKQHIVRWQKVAPDRWREVGDDEVQQFYKPTVRIEVNGCPGTVVQAFLDAKSWRFIPDKKCPGMPFSISYDGANFGIAANMTDVL
jgi:hypothetical protein